MPGNWKRLLVTCVLALICGVAGGWLHTALSGSSSSNQQGERSKKADKSSPAAAGQSNSGDQAGSKSGSDGESTSKDGAAAVKTAGLNASQDGATITKDAWLDANFEHLSHRVDLLGKRLSKMTLPEQESPAVLHALRMQVTDLENDFEQVAGLPAKMRQLERDIAALNENFTLLKQRVPGEDVPAATEERPTDAGLSAPLSDLPVNAPASDVRRETDGAH